MPLRHRTSIKEPAVFFITTSTHDRGPFPGYPVSLTMIEETLLCTVRDKQVTLMGYVLMPTHVHLISGSNAGGPGISAFMHSFKGRVRKKLVGNRKLWQDRFDDLVLRTERQFRVKLEYIHNNPVRSGLVEKPEDWRFTSYNDWKNEDPSRGITFDFGWLK